MGKVSFKYGTASQLANAPYLEGTFYVISDNESTDGILYADLNNKRICFGDVASLVEDVSDLESSIPTKVSELTNDSNFITAVDLSNYVQSTYYENGIEADITNNSGAVLMGVWNENDNKSGKFEIQSDGIAKITSSNFLQIYGSGQNVQINNLVTPTSNYMAANKKYVDDSIAGITIPTVPTTVSSFTNDAGYLTTATLPIYDGTVV